MSDNITSLCCCWALSKPPRFTSDRKYLCWGPEITPFQWSSSERNIDFFTGIISLVSLSVQSHFYTQLQHRVLVHIQTTQFSPSEIQNSNWHRSRFLFSSSRQHVWKSHISPIFWLIFIYSHRFCQAHMLVLWMINAFVIMKSCFSIPGQSFQMENRFSSLMNLWGLLTGPSWGGLRGGTRPAEQKRCETKHKLPLTTLSTPGSFLDHLYVHFPLPSAPPGLCSYSVWKFRGLYLCGYPMSTINNSFSLTNVLGVEVSWQPVHHIFNDAYLSCTAWILSVVGLLEEGGGIIRERTSGYESLMCGERDPSSPPTDISSRGMMMVPCSVWPPRACESSV